MVCLTAQYVARAVAAGAMNDMFLRSALVVMVRQPAFVRRPASMPYGSPNLTSWEVCSLLALD